jgi:hypothetical protein
MVGGKGRYFRGCVVSGRLCCSMSAAWPLKEVLCSNHGSAPWRMHRGPCPAAHLPAVHMPYPTSAVGALLRSCPQVLKRVGQECEAHGVVYWTAARDGNFFQVGGWGREAGDGGRVGGVYSKNGRGYWSGY